MPFFSKIPTSEVLQTPRNCHLGMQLSGDLRRSPPYITALQGQSTPRACVEVGPSLPDLPITGLHLSLKVSAQKNHRGLIAIPLSSQFSWMLYQLYLETGEICPLNHYLGQRKTQRLSPHKAFRCSLYFSFTLRGIQVYNIKLYNFNKTTKHSVRPYK